MTKGGALGIRTAIETRETNRTLTLGKCRKYRLNKTTGGTVVFVNKNTVLVLGPDFLIYRLELSEHRYIDMKNLREGTMVTLTYTMKDEFTLDRVTALLPPQEIVHENDRVSVLQFQAS